MAERPCCRVDSPQRSRPDSAAQCGAPVSSPKLVVFPSFKSTMQVLHRYLPDFHFIFLNKPAISICYELLKLLISKTKIWLNIENWIWVDPIVRLSCRFGTTI